jgi:hypothetical protein
MACKRIRQLLGEWKAKSDGFKLDLADKGFQCIVRLLAKSFSRHQISKGYESVRDRPNALYGVPRSRSRRKGMRKNKKSKMAWTLMNQVSLAQDEWLFGFRSEVHDGRPRVVSREARIPRALVNAKEGKGLRLVS